MQLALLPCPSNTGCVLCDVTGLSPSFNAPSCYRHHQSPSLAFSIRPKIFTFAFGRPF